MAENNQKKLVIRPPVVVVVGHIDHGKTSLLDQIRKTNIVEKESGGITQHIGAYELKHQDKAITFIDTPGHEAFSAIRSRGAKVADIAILVIAATEGVKAQTKEAIFHIKLAQIPTIVALNKMDLPQANPEQAKRELEKAGIRSESLGGKVPSVEVSAKTGQGIQDLLELILLVAEMEDLKTEISVPAEGVIIEAYLDSKRGPTATLLVRKGRLEKDKVLGTPSTYGSVRILEDFRGRPLGEAVPSQPAVVVGFEEVPQVGEEFKVYFNLEEARQRTEQREKNREGRVIVVEQGKRILNLILKTDVLGSLEAICGVLESLPQEKVVVRILAKEVGGINERDIKLARAGKAKILGFRIKPDAVVKKLVEKDKIKIMTFDVIYELVQAVRTLMEKQLVPEKAREDLGKLKTSVVFKRDKNRQIVGGKILEGEITKGVMIEVFRAAPLARRAGPGSGGEGEKIGQGKLVNLQKNKKDISRAVRGDEIGILYEGEGIIEEGDILVIYKEKRKKGEL